MSGFLRIKRTLRTIAIAIVILSTVALACFAVFRPRPARLVMTARAGDDTVVVNQVHRARLSAFVFDQYRRPLHSDSAVRFQRLSGDSVRLSADGQLQCDKRGDAVVRATFQQLSRDFVLRCRPVASVESATWIDLVVGDSTRDLSFVARDPDGRTVTELRGSVIVTDASVVSAEGTTIRPKRSGQAAAIIQVGDGSTHIPIVVYQPVTSFVDNPKVQLMAMRVSLTRGDTIEAPLPASAFWVTYFAQDRSAPPPTIELRGQGSCTTGNGLTVRRIEDGEYAKYCYATKGDRMMIAHGASGAAIVNGVVAIRIVW